MQCAFGVSQGSILLSPLKAASLAKGNQDKYFGARGPKFESVGVQNGHKQCVSSYLGCIFGL